MKSNIINNGIFQRNSFVWDISLISIRYTGKNIDKKEVWLPQDFLDSIEIVNLFFLPVTTPVESCCWAWSKLDPDSASTTPYLNENGFGGPLNGSLELMAGLAVVRLILIERSKTYNIIMIGFSDYIILRTLFKVLATKNCSCSSERVVHN